MEYGPQFEALLIAAKSGGLPFAVALAGLALARVAGRRGAAQRESAAPITVSMLLAILAGFAAMNHDQWRFPPAQALDWLPLVAAGSGLALAPLVRRAGKSGWLASQAVLAGGAAWAVLPPAVAAAGTGNFAAWWLGTAAATLAVWRFLDGFCVPRSSAVGLMLCSGALALIVGLGGSILIGCVAASLAAALAAWILVGVAGGWPPLPQPLLGALVLLFCNLLVTSYFYAEISPFALGGVMLGLFTVRLARPLLLRGGPSRWRELAFSVAAAALPLSVPVGFALWNFMQQSPAY